MLNGEVYPQHAAPGPVPDAEGEQIMIITLKLRNWKKQITLAKLLLANFCTCCAALWRDSHLVLRVCKLH